MYFQALPNRWRQLTVADDAVVDQLNENIGSTVKKSAYHVPASGSRLIDSLKRISLAIQKCTTVKRHSAFVMFVLSCFVT